MVVGALSVLLGYHARAGAWVLVLFLIPVTLFMHAFWRVADPGPAQLQQVMFLKNVAILGGALLVATSAPARSASRCAKAADPRSIPVRPGSGPPSRAPGPPA
jgi:uncharacterized membrane protein YphA (DoxX/SURF4 family)